jgi:dipeptide transport system permease protein
MVNIQLFSHPSNISRDSMIESRWTIYSSTTSAMIGLIGLSLITLLAIAGAFMENPSQAGQLLPPLWHESGTTRHILGTDLVGRDIFTRLVQGAPLTLGTSVISVTFALIIGVGLGLIAAYFRGYVQLLVMRTMDIVFAIPSLVLAIIVVAILGPGLVNAGIAVGIVLLPNFVRTTTSHVIEEMQKPYVDAALLDGASPMRILFKSVFPNISAPLILTTTIALSTAIIEIALLGFLGLGAQSPSPEWGIMLAEARTSMHIAPWAVTAPGLAIMITVLFINFIGDGLNRVINQKKRY